LFPLFATGVVDTGGNLPHLLLTPVANSPPVSKLLAKMVAKFAAGVVDTGGKFAVVLLITAAILPLLSFTPVANLPPVSLIPVVHLDF
jgi:hypothetical protein